MLSSSSTSPFGISSTTTTTGNNNNIMMNSYSHSSSSIPTPTSTASTPTMSSSLSQSQSLSSSASLFFSSSSSSSFHSAISQLEHQLTIPPPNYNGQRGNSHAIAHASLEALQEAGDPQFLFLRSILERPSSEELLFHCITGSRQVLLTRWEAFSEIFVCAVRDFFMTMGEYYYSNYYYQQQQYSTTTTSTPSSSITSIRLACFTSSVAIWKRQWNGDNTSNGMTTPDYASMEGATTATATATAEGSNQRRRQRQSPSPQEEQIMNQMNHFAYTILEQQQQQQQHTQQQHYHSQLRTFPRIANKLEFFEYLNQQIIMSLSSTPLLLPPTSPASISSPTSSSSSSIGGDVTTMSTQLYKMESTCQYLSTLVGEFSGKSIVSYRLPMEFHKQAYKIFEKDHLEDCLRLSMNALSKIVQMSSSLSSSPASQSSSLFGGGGNGIDSIGSDEMATNDDTNNTTTTTTTLMNSSPMFLAIAKSVVQANIDIIGWEFGAGDWMHLPSSQTLTRPPSTWNQYLIQPDFIGAVFSIHATYYSMKGTLTNHNNAGTNSSIKINNHNNNNNSSNKDLAHTLRQLLLLLCSLSGPIFREKQERMLFAQFLCEGTRTLPSLFHQHHRQQQQQYYGNNNNNNNHDDNDASLIYDVFSLVSKLITNFRLNLLADLPSFLPLLESLASTGTALLRANLQECESVNGDLDRMENQDWREEALALLLEAIALLCQDPWLCDEAGMMASPNNHYNNKMTTSISFSPDNDAKLSADALSRQTAQHKLMQTLGPLYSEFVRCRTRMTYLAEHWAVKEGQTSDEERENIEALGMEEELKVVACLGRLHLPSALATMSTAFQEVLPRLESVWQESDGSTPDAAGLLKECSLLLKYVGHLLTDEKGRQDPTLRVPPSIEMACRYEEGLLNDTAYMVRGVLSLMHVQASKVATSPSNLRLSSDLSQQFLWFLTRWTPIYVCGAADENASNILLFWSSRETAQEVVDFCIWLCSQYQCFLPQEIGLQESVSEFLVTLARGNPRLRASIVQSSNFHQMVMLECLCMRPCLSLGDLGAAIVAKNMPVSVDMLQGSYCRPIEAKAQVLTAILIASGDSNNETSNQIFNECLKAVHETFMSLISVSGNNSADTRILARASVALLGDVANAASNISDPERIPSFLSPIFPRLSGLMANFAGDLLICEGLLRLFRDYTKVCLFKLDQLQTGALLEAISNLLKSYSAHHCTSRVVTPKSGKENAEEEEQAYSDILCTLELLMSLAKGGSSSSTSSNNNNSNSSIIATTTTDVVFLGLQQIIPLMTQGLLTYPSLCLEYFSLVGFMMESHADRLFALPYDLIDALICSLLQGSTHHDAQIANKCLVGIQGLAKAQLKMGSLSNHLQHHHDNLLDRCTKHILRDIIFQQIIFDRMEATSDALLILIALDVHRFALLVRELSQSILSRSSSSSSTGATNNNNQQEQQLLQEENQQQLLNDAFQKLVQQDVINNALADGWEGRANRRRFKEDLEAFVNTTNSFLVFK